MSRDVIPGRTFALAAMVVLLATIVLAPLLMIFIVALGDPQAALSAIDSARTLAAFRLSIGASFVAAAIDLVLGTTIAWALVRRRFIGRSLLDALVETPFALPTAVAGIALATLDGPHGWIGAPLAMLGVRVAYTPLGVVIALAFVGLPFVVRSVQTALAELAPAHDEAARSLGTGDLGTLWRISLPMLAPTLLTAFSAAFARAIGEYGSVVFIAGNLPGRTEIAPLLVVTHIESGDAAGAAAIAALSMVISLAILGALAFWERRLVRRRVGG
ncbi:MAG TPA: sulfate ABC transporter permease subunit CysT [Candidatus Baltobacteraceae bacterium]|nr:sulfate ABC transporter permease subunit CysT [Candidatus Baltobacteraceae bacterium]